MKQLVILLSTVIIVFSACKDNSIQKEYFPNGKLKRVAEMKDGKRNGLTTNYDPEGRIISTAEMKDDLYNGWMLTYNPKNHKVTARAFFVNDTQNGPVTLYYSDGQLYRESFYKKGLVDSVVTTYWKGKKIQAINYFKDNQPAVGLVEYDQDGNKVKQPYIVVEEINQLSLMNTVTLKIYLSNHSSDVKFYSGELKEGKYFDPESTLMYSDITKGQKGVVYQKYQVPKKYTLMKKVSIVSKCRTEFGNTLVLHKTYNLAVSN